MAGSENEHNNSSSGEEEEEEEEFSSEGSESESEPDKTSTPPPSSKKTQITPNSSSSSESESDPEPVPDPTIKPISSKPMDLDAGSKKPRSKIPASRFSPPPITGKRPAEVEDDGGDAKRAKKTVVAVAAPDAGLVADNGGEKKMLFQRLWSEENEIELIQGMINYVEEKGKDPGADVNDFHDFVKESLHVDVNDKQVLTKVRRLKKKYENNASKVEKDGKVRSFSNPHEKKMYELSKNLWGSDRNKNVVMSSNKKVNVKVNVTPKTNNKSGKAVGVGNGDVEVPANEFKGSFLSGHVGSTGLVLGEEGIMIKGLELLSGAKKIEMMKKWKELKVEELKHFVKKVDILKEQAVIVVDAIDKSGAN